MDRIRTTLDPSRYHGYEAGRPFFEGWYFKLVDGGERRRFAVIPGVFRGVDPSTDHAFVQVLDGTTGEATYTRYPATDFWAARDRFEVSIGPNRFSADYLSLDLRGQERTAHGLVEFRGLTPWPVTLRSPGIMGWYAWAPFMECYHGIVSLDHALVGRMMLEGETIDFTGGRGYTEKDWGRSFPSAWIWTQTNHFERPGTSLTASVAIIPWLGGAFPGFIAGLWHEGRLYRFATYSGARLERLTISGPRVELTMRDKRHALDLTLSRAEGGLIRAPTGIDMDRRIAESMQSSVTVRLTETKGEPRTLFEGVGRNAGLEVAGDLERLLAMNRGRRTL